MVYIIIGAILLFVLIIWIISGNSNDDYEHKQYDYEQREIKAAGIRGESICKNELEHVLHIDDVLISNVCLNANGKEAEIDNLIINKNGIFIVEVKNYNGEIYGDIDDYEWTKIKVSPGGNTFEKKVKNPIKQMKRQTYILSQYLKENGIRIWITPFAYFINGNSPVDDESVINDIDELDTIIHQSHERVYDDKVISKAVRLLSDKLYT